MTSFKVGVLIGFFVLAGLALVSDSHFIPIVSSNSAGPPPLFTGAPGEMLCNQCHVRHDGPGQMHINAPSTYVPGQTYPIRVTHTTTDPTRLRWGFELTAVAGLAPGGSFADTTPFTQLQFHDGGRVYVEHNLAGTFAGQPNGAEWTFNWVAPAEDLGPVTFYAAGDQADNDGTEQGDQIYTATAIAQPVQTAARNFDYDGDGLCDISIFRPSSGAWYLQRSRDGLYGAEFGYSDDLLTPADFDGDGKTDIAVYRPSTGIWYIFQSTDGNVRYEVFGLPGDLPVPADYDRDGIADVGMFRPSTATWYIKRSSDGSFFAMEFGQTGDKPTVGDFDGDARSDVAVFRPSDGAWYQFNSSNSQVTGAQFGFGSDIIAPADYDGDNRTDLAVFRPANGFWYIANSSDSTVTAFPFGISTDVPAPGDFDGDGRADLSVFRPSDGNWYRMNSSNGSFFAYQFGADGDRPTQTAFRY
jgi:hypothetical protein